MTSPTSPGMNSSVFAFFHRVNFIVPVIEQRSGKGAVFDIRGRERLAT